MDVLLLSRIQFAANISFHILFPTITIAMCWLLLFFRLRYAATRGTPDAAGWEAAPTGRVTWKRPATSPGHCWALRC